MNSTKPLMIIAVASFVLCAGAAAWLPYKKSFPFNGSNYVATMDREGVMSGPSWDSFTPPPLTFAAVEQAARKELRKFVQDEPSWEVETFEVRHLRGTQKWYYGVELSPSPERAKNTGPFTVYIDFAGKPGRVEQGHL
jgi:hypothetical protein